MTGPWEQRLTNFAEGGVPWDVPHRYELESGLESLLQVVQKVAADPGLIGQSGDAAKNAISATAAGVAQQIDYVRSHLPARLDQANDVRSRARNDLASLPAGSMSGTQENVVRGAAVGTTFLLGPLSFLAGEGAVGVINNYLASQREQAAQDMLRTYSDEMDSVAVARPPVFDATFWDDDDKEQPPHPPSWPTDDGRGGRSGGRSFEKYPDWDASPIAPSPGGGVGDDSPQPELHTMPQPHVIGPRPDGPISGDIPIIDLDTVAPGPTPDGSVIGTPSMPGGIPSAPGGGLLGGSGGTGAGIGSGLGAGLIAGGGGAAALGRIARGAGSPGGSLFGGAGGTAASGAAGRSGGLLGKTAAAGSGLGTRGVGGMGGATAGGGAPASSAATGAGMRVGGAGVGGTGGGVGGTGGGGVGGTGGRAAGGGTAGGGAAGGGAAGGGVRGTSGGSRGVGGMGGPGSRSDRRDEASRGLGGPIAPRMEDDEEIGPRSENAQAGGRDE